VGVAQRTDTCARAPERHDRGAHQRIGLAYPTQLDGSQQQRVRVRARRQRVEQRRGHIAPQHISGDGETSRNSDAGSPKTAPAAPGRNRTPTSHEPGGNVTTRDCVSGPATVGAAAAASVSDEARFVLAVVRRSIDREMLP
jgi:hypothetical protein